MRRKDVVVVGGGLGAALMVVAGYILASVPCCGQSCEWVCAQDGSWWLKWIIYGCRCGN